MRSVTSNPPIALPELDSKGTYLTFTLSDGDQLMMMSTAQLGNWYNPNRGKMAFNWEVQPLLVELAPALLEKFQAQSTSNDCLIAGPSGAGYIIPPLAPQLSEYLFETNRICEKANLKVVTSYVADPPKRVLRQICENSPSLIVFLGGYAIFQRVFHTLIADKVYISNQIPRLAHIADSAEDLLKSVSGLLHETETQKPRFIAVHIFAYRTTYQDILQFVESLDEPHIHIVRGDVFLQLAKQVYSR